jgi:Domain of unknown function (DUF3854)/Family of unknown function (DUF5906)
MSPGHEGHRPIQDLCREKWESSGLTALHARKLHFRAMSASQVEALGKPFQAAGGLKIPYFDLKGHPTKFFRVRYLEPLPGIQLEKPLRYMQPATIQEAYFPPLVPWADLSQDKEPLYITEGELKAASAAANAIPMLALGGVYSFMSSRRGVDFLYTLKQIRWKERIVRIVYDNDLSKNADVLRAQNQLAERLTAEGAVVEFISLPAGPAKGVDDFIVAYGADALKALEPVPFLEGAGLWAMNADVVLIKNDGVPIVMETKPDGAAMSPQVFMQTMYANRSFDRMTVRAKQVHHERVSLAKHWMEWPNRSELDSLTYEPGSPKVIQGKQWNTWSSWGVSPRKGDVRPWIALLDYLFDHDPKTRRYFEQWLAYPIQHPGAKLYVATVLWSRVKRLGKSMIGIAMKYIYGDNAIFVDSRQLKSSFNSWAKDRQLVIGEEITAGEARMDADYMKNIITNPFFTINSKFKAEYTIPNRTNFMMLSNHPDAAYLEDGDERYLIHGIHHRKPQERVFYERLDKWLHGSGPSHLMHYLLQLSLKGFNPREHAPHTVSKTEMIGHSKTDMGLWVQLLADDPTQALKALGQAPSQGCDLFTVEQLFRAFDPENRKTGRASVIGLGKTLEAAGFRGVNGAAPMGTASGIKRLRAVRNSINWEQAGRGDIREHYDQFFGPGAAGGVK